VAPPPSPYTPGKEPPKLSRTRAEEKDLCQYDIDCDGQINPVDSGIVQSLFGTCDAPPDVCP